MSYEVWKTVFSEDFNAEKYIYHFTSVENAMSIIDSNNICFSDLSETNDYFEEKVAKKYSFIKDDNVDRKKALIDNYLQLRNDKIQILCFCTDKRIKPAIKASILKDSLSCEKDKYYNVFGRGFANHLMWSRFSSSNPGVCLIFNKRAFENILKIEVNSFDSKAINYLSINKAYSIKNADSLVENIIRVKRSKKSFVNLMKNNETYTEYNFFYKRSDWINENEYRYIAFKDNKDDILKVGEVEKYLEGIVVKQNIEMSDETKLKLSKNNLYTIQKICFLNGYCYLCN